MSSSGNGRNGGYALGIDVGGTFTDVVLAGPKGQVAAAKALSTHDDPTQGIIAGVRSALTAGEVAAEQITRVVHATTLATNAILEGAGVRVAHVTTQGFRAMLPLGRYARVEEDRFDLRFDPPASPVPAEDCFEVPERIGADGRVLKPLDENAVRAVARQITAKGIRSVSVALLHSYANPAHEQRVGELLREALPAETRVVTSTEIWPEMREYERSTTTLMSAYIGPIMVSYLANLEDRLAGLGVKCRVQVMESGGGVMSADLAGRRAVATIESGPAAGVIAARFTGEAAGHEDVISFDMGGTTAKACVVRGGKPDITHEFHVGGKGSFGGRRAGTGVPIKIPAIDLAEVGAGGGSIAWVDEGGALRVGPRSAGSSPGPACYGLGGEEPTVTDANLVLGYLDPSAFAGGTMKLAPELAEKAVADRIARPLGVSIAEAANAVHEIANATMGSAVHVVTVQRGVDPRRFAVVASGGAGPMHAARVAERFDIPTVLVPPSCGVGSAVGLLATDLSTDGVQTRVLPEPAGDFAELERIFGDLEGNAADDLGVSLDSPDVEVSRSVDIRFVGQAHEIRVDLPKWPLDAAAFAELKDRFFAGYEQAYGIALRGDVQLVSFRVRVTKRVPKVPLGRRPASSGGTARMRAVWFPEYGEYRDTPVLERDALVPGSPVAGPAIIGDHESTIVVPPGWSAEADSSYTVVLSRKETSR
ncbi:hydantoinase/oxoprolinase family protein [Amycolatopsis circi]|uniref:hydantoinase/oxoprolinase family protein n=1 Tax=Amycolatopsis circi TaxID=871959 RepID=UPI000E26F906|nr:hydantoinase/oxoprolinase family protein [Amycolatopsis circi]